MKFFLHAGIAFGAVAVVAANDAVVTQDNLIKDDAKFWNRLLQNDEGSIPRPPSPTAPTPTNVPPAPTPEPPTPTQIPPTPTTGTPGDCMVNVAITCVTRDDGTPCDEITPPNPKCADGSEVNSLTFGYSGNSCDPTANKQGSETFCEDNSPIVFLDEVTVLCRDGEVPETALVVEPPIVQPGGTFSVSSASGGPLPSKVDCIFTDMDDTILQQVVIDASGDVQLDLTDEFGAFTLLSCELPSSPAGGQSCLEILTYTIDISNTGDVDMDITVVDFTFGGATNDLLGEVDTKTVSPGDSTTVSPIVLIDLCAGAEFCADINVEAEPANGAMCQDSEKYCFQVSPLPPTPVPPPTPDAPTNIPPPTPDAPTNIPPPTPDAPTNIPPPTPDAPTNIPPPTPDAPTNIPPPTPDAPTTIPPPVVPTPPAPYLPTVPTSAPKSKNSKNPDSKGPDSKGPTGPGVVGSPTNPPMPSSKGPDSKGPDSKGPDSKGPTGPGVVGPPTFPPMPSMPSSKGPDSKNPSGPGVVGPPSSLPSSKSKEPGFINPGVIQPGSPTASSKSGSMSGGSSGSGSMSGSSGSMSGSSGGSSSKSGSSGGSSSKSGSSGGSSSKSGSSGGSSSKSGSSGGSDSMSSSGSDSMSSSGSDSMSSSGSDSMSSSGSSSKGSSGSSSKGSDSKSTTRRVK